MISQQETVHVERSGGATESTFQIKASRKAFDVLSSALYSDKIKAIVRELSVNGYDSHIANGNADTPIEIHLPTLIDPQFYVRDLGTGLPKEAIIGKLVPDVGPNGELTERFVPGIYQTFFDSNKADSDDFVGMLGLGSKSPLSYTSQFMVESRHGETKNTYCVFKNEEGLPVVRLMNEEPLGDEPTGMTITLAVRPSDVDKFCTAARKALMYFTPLPTFVGQTGFKPYDLRHTVTGSNWKLRESEYYAYMSGPFVVQGFIAYPVDHNLIAEHQKLTPEAAALCSVDLDIYVDIGKVDVAPSREALSYDRRTISNLVCSLEEAADEMRKSFQEAFDACNTLWEAWMLMDKYMNGQGEKFKGIFKQMHKTAPFTWKGNDLSHTAPIKLSGITSTSISCASLSDSKKKVRWANQWNPGHDTDFYELKATGAIVVLVDDTPKSKSDILLQHLQSLRAVNSHRPMLVVIRPTDAKSFSQSEVDKIIAAIGNPPHALVSSLPYTSRTRGAASRLPGVKRDKSVMLKWTGFTSKEGRYWNSERQVHRVFSRLTWSPTPVDIEEGGIYVPIERFNAVMKYNGAICTNLDTIIAHAKTMGLIDDDVEVIGMSEKELARAQKQGEWICLFDEIVSNFEMDNENNELVNKLITTEIRSRIDQGLPNFSTNIMDNWDSLSYRLTDGPFKSFVQHCVDFEGSVGDTDPVVTESLMRMLHIPVKIENEVEDALREFKGMVQKYSMFPIIGWVSMVPSNFPHLIEYINSVDLARDPA